MPWEEESGIIVFQSNRGPLKSWDISSFRLRDGRVVGGIQQLTRDSRLNYGPTLTSEHQSIFFTSIETYPKAEPIISSVRPDGSSFTSLGEIGEMLFAHPSNVIFFVRTAEDTQKQQIYSITSEGLSFSSVINDMQFSEADCFAPALNPDGRKLLFVSDYYEDEQGRKNNDIFIYDMESARIERITDNSSDDINPRWSPTESGVIFFLSNRGGAYNIWRITRDVVD